MPRVVRKPEERRQELMDTAEHLFRERGFENVQVSDIVASLGVAQGTFYYYFPSKDDAMLAILERNWGMFAKTASARIGSSTSNPRHRLLALMRSFFVPVDSEHSVESYFGKDANSDLVRRFHTAFDEMRLRLFGPIIAQIVSEGMEQGLFARLAHTQGIVEAVFLGISSYMHAHGAALEDPAVACELAGTIGELLERILGLDKGSFDILGPEGEQR